MPRPSCARYSRTPPPASVIAAIAPRSWSPQSQRRLASRSPVKHSEWSRTSAGPPGPGAPIRIARCSVPPSPGRKAISLASSASASGTRASATWVSPAIAARRVSTSAVSTVAKSVRRRASAASAGASGNTSAAGNSAASLASATAASSPPAAATGSGPSPGGSAPSEAAGSASLRITVAGSSGASAIDTAPESASRRANPKATARRRVKTTCNGRAETSRRRCKLSSLTNSAARASTAPYSPASNTGSPRRKAVIAISRARPPSRLVGSDEFNRSTTRHPVATSYHKALDARDTTHSRCMSANPLRRARSGLPQCRAVGERRQAQGSDGKGRHDGRAEARESALFCRCADRLAPVWRGHQQVERAAPTLRVGGEEAADPILDRRRERLGRRSDGRHADNRRLEKLQFALGFAKRVVGFERGQVDVGFGDRPQQLGRRQEPDPFHPVAVPPPLRPEIEMADQAKPQFAVPVHDFEQGLFAGREVALMGAGAAEITDPDEAVGRPSGGGDLIGDAQLFAIERIRDDDAGPAQRRDGAAERCGADGGQIAFEQ